MYVNERFVLNSNLLHTMTPEFGYNGFGETVFYRTYSRIKADGGQENWADVVTRVINGCFSIRKDHYARNRIPWCERTWQDYALKMAVSLFHMEWMPPGRGLWAMGTDFVYERGAMGLYNCAFIELIDSDLPDAFSWLMDSLMNGVGVGFAPTRSESLRLYPDAGRPTYTVVIPDSREGWCEATASLIRALMSPDAYMPVFDYSLIRKKGMPIRGFGGLASGPEPLEHLHKEIIRSAERYYTQQIDSVMFKTDVANMIGCCVVAGNVRRSAEIACCPISDPTFLDLKNYDKFPYRLAHGWMSNNSVILEHDEDFERLGEIAERVIKNGEPGYVNARNLPKGRIGKDDNLRVDKAIGLNPCLSKESKVFVADGRGYVDIGILAAEGKDVPVFCVDGNDEIVVRTMRNPRKTGEKVKVYKVILDDGSIIRVTGNHRFMLRDRSFKEVRNMVPGESLAIVNRYTPMNSPNTYWDHYYSLSYGAKTVIEHRVAKGLIPGVAHIDHLDGNKCNNYLSNLEVKSEYVHLNQHSEGLANPNSSGFSNEDLVSKGVALATKLGRRFSTKEWLSGGIQFSDFRKKEFGSLFNFAYLCADLAGVKNDNVDSRTLRHIVDLESQNYDVELIDTQVYVYKTCESCNKDFLVLANRREQSFCSLHCSNIGRDYSKNLEGQRKYYNQKRESLREKQLAVYVDLKAKLGKLPQKKEWVEACKASAVSAEICRASSPFQSYKQLQSNAITFNHKIAFILEDGEEDVYNGTVDDFHNFIVGGWKKTLISGREVEIGIVNPQCGEIPLESGEVCNLSETCPTRCDSVEDWYKACEYASFYSSTVSLLPTHQERTNRVVARNRRIGVSIIDFTGWIEAESLAKVTRYLRNGYKIVRDTNKWANGEAGVPEAIRVTTMKPGGTVPKLVGRKSGMMFANFEYMIRRMRIQQNSPIYNVLHAAGVPHEPDVFSANTEVFEFPVHVEGRTADKVSLWEQACLLVLLQREWADNAVSNTLNFRPAWQVIAKYPGGSTRQTSEGVEVFGKDGEIYFYEFGQDLRITADIKNHEVRVEQYDLMHEEDIIENVLSLIAPFTKSVALLPYTKHGVYPQMPESGIDEREYLQRVEAIKTIDWTSFRNSDGQDEMFCTGETCALPPNSGS
jgi:hypothetical protein